MEQLYLLKNLSRRHFVRHKSHVTWIAVFVAGKLTCITKQCI